MNRAIVLRWLLGLLGLAALAPPSAARSCVFGLLSAAPVLLAIADTWDLELGLTIVLASFWLWPALLNLGPWPVVVVAVVCCLCHRRQPVRLVLHRSDLWVLPVALPVALLVLRVYLANGMQADGSYVAHGWFGRDTAYLWALAEESVRRGGYPSENPWLGGVTNTYASWAHLGLGALSKLAGQPAALSLHGLVCVYLVCAPALWVLAAASHGVPRWFAALVVGLVVAVRPDLFCFPQAQSVCFGGLAVLLALRRPWAGADLGVWRWLRLLLAMELVLSHPAIGVAALLLDGFLMEREFRVWVPPLVLAAAALAMWAGSSLVEDPVSHWFVEFNAPRFLLLAVLCAIPAVKEI